MNRASALTCTAQCARSADRSLLESRAVKHLDELMTKPFCMGLTFFIYSSDAQYGSKN